MTYLMWSSPTASQTSSMSSAVLPVTGPAWATSNLGGAEREDGGGKKLTECIYGGRTRHSGRAVCVCEGGNSHFKELGDVSNEREQKKGERTLDPFI